jgi:hypothetical protein
VAVAQFDDLFYGTLDGGDVGGALLDRFVLVIGLIRLKIANPQSLIL